MVYVVIRRLKFPPMFEKNYGNCFAFIALALTTVWLGACSKQGETDRVGMAVSAREYTLDRDSADLLQLIAGPVAARGKWLPPDSLARPRSLPFTSPPLTTPAFANKEIAGSPAVVSMSGQQKIVRPGEAGVLLPQALPARAEMTAIKQPKPSPAQSMRINKNASYDIQYLDVDQGMTSAYIRSLLEDSRGYLWFGTSFGLSRYDGKQFIHYTVEEGLPSNVILSLLEDSRGVIWIGTDNGLSRYDGHTFTHYLHDAPQGNIGVRTLLEASSGDLWLGTFSHGVLRFSPAAGQFTHYTSRTGLTHDRIEDIIEDSHGHLWIATRGGLSRFTPDEDYGTFRQYRMQDGLPDSVITAIQEDEQGRFWLATNKGLSCLQPDAPGGPTLRHYSTREGLLHNEVWFVMNDSRNQLWFGTGHGVSCFDGTHFTHYRVEEGLNSNTVRTALEDKAGNIWLGTGGGGINRLNPNSFTHITGDSRVSNNDFTAIASGRQGALWLGTGGSAIQYDGHSFTHYTAREGLAGELVEAVLEDSRGRLWVGTEKGVSQLDPAQRTWTYYNTETGLIDNKIRILFEDSRGNIWMGSGNGLSCVHGPGHPYPGSITNYTVAEGLLSNNIRDVLEDRQGNIWIASSRGLSRFHPNQEGGGEFMHYSSGKNGSGIDVLTMATDNKGGLWYGTKGYGLYYYDTTRSASPFIAYTTQDGLSHNIIWSLQADKQDNIWMSTEKGITLMQRSSPVGQEAASDAPPAPKFYTFYKEEGLKRLDFQDNCIALDQQNHIWWGGQGLTRLDLQRFQLPSAPPVSLQLTQLEINQEFLDYRRLADSAYRNKLRFGEELHEAFDSVPAFANYPLRPVLPYHLNHLTFHFSSHAWLAPLKIRYQFFLQGLDRQWSFPSSNPVADYRNLSPGAYTFHVRAGVEGDNWSEPLAYAFTIRPPIWLTPWAYSLYLLVLAGIVYWVYSFLHNRWQLRNELRKEQEAAAHLKEVDELKTQFFTNISHELRTPLTLVLAPISSLLEEGQLSKKQRQLLHMASSNGIQLRQLIDDILDLRKLEMRKMEIDRLPVELAPFFRRCCSQFESWAERKKIIYELQVEVAEGVVAEIDREKCRQMLNNLLSNAFKFTPEAGRVTALIALREGWLHLHIADTGPGIHPDDRPQLFDRYFQARHPDRMSRGGTGIGLALCREYIQLFGGRIKLQSEPGQGATFKLSFPVNLIDAEALPEPSMPMREPILLPVQPEEMDEEAQGAFTDTGGERATVLVVEDHEELRTYLQLVLSSHYRVLTASHGREALDILQQPTLPNLILSDLMMPVMDGYELLEKLKSADTTRHIPVIMLTARADVRDKLKALRIGVDDYLLKPYEEEELLVRIENLLRRQTDRRVLVEADGHSEPADVNTLVSQADREWLEAFEAYVEQHLYNDILSVPLLASAFNMSESTLLRQLKRLTGLSPAKYLLEMRLQEARHLLENRIYGSIAEVAYKIGYSDTRSFSRSFKKRFGKLPSDLLGQAVDLAD